MYYCKRILLLLVCFASVLPLHAKKLALEVYAALPSASMVRISPDGTHFAYRHHDEKQDYLMVREVASNKAIGAIDVSEIDPKNLYFLDNNRLILKTSAYMGLYGYSGRHNVKAAYVYNVKDKSVRQLLIPGYGIYRGQTQVSDVIGVKLDEDKVMMPAYYGEDGRRYEAPVYTLMSVRLDKKRKPKRLTNGTHDAIDFFVDEAGELLVQERYNNENDIHRVQVRDGNSWRDIYTETTPIRTKSFVGLTPQRDKLVMLMYDDSGRNNYYTMALSDGKIEGPIFVNPNADIESVLTDIHRVVYGVRYAGFYPDYKFFDANLDKIYQGLKSEIADHSIQIADYSPDWKNIVFHIEGPEILGGYFLYTPSGFVNLANQREQINPANFNPVVIREFKANDGLTIPTLLTYPANTEKPAKKLPAIMMPHGGPESYDQYSFDWLAQFFANRGYLVIQPQFRGSKGFGAEHILAGRGEWGGKMQSDLNDTLDTLIASGEVDAEKVCIFGISYGGYAALAGATFTPDKYRCAISVNGVSDLTEMLDKEKYDYGSDHWVVSYWEDSMAKKKVSDDFLESISPINFTKQVKTPVLLIHGEIDKVVDIEQSEDMFDELEDEDKLVKFVELEDEGHHLIYPQSRLKLLQEVETFLNKYNKAANTK